MELLFFLALVALFIAARSANTKIKRLEHKVDALTKELGVSLRPTTTAEKKIELATEEQIEAEQSFQPSISPTPIPTPSVFDSKQQFTSTSQPESLGTISSPVESQPFFLYEWFKEHTLIKIGSIIFFFGAAWFVTYAFDQNWVPPMVRVLMGLTLAVIIYGIGIIRESVDRTQYVVLTALGSGVVFVSVLAAQFSFSVPLLPGIVSLLILVVAIVYTVFAALTTDTEWLAVAAAVASLLAPQFSGTDVSSVTPLFLYLFCISAGLGAVVLFTAWRFVTLSMVVGVSIYALLASDIVSQQMITWLFVIFFSLLFLGVTTISILRNRVPLLTDGVTLLLVGLLYVYFVDTVAVLPAAAMFAAAAATAGIGYVARLQEVAPAAVLLYAVCSVVGIFAGTSYLFDGVTATFFFALEAAALVLLAMRLAFLEKTIYFATATFSLPVLLGFFVLGDAAWETGIIHAPAIAALAVSSCLGGIGYYQFSIAERTGLGWLQALSSLVLGVWYVFTTVALIVVASSIANFSTGSVALWSTLLLLILSVCLTALTLSKTERVQARSLVLWTYVLPLGFASALIIESSLAGAFGFSTTVTLSAVLATLVCLTGLYAYLARLSHDPADDSAWYILLWTAVLLVSFWINSVYGVVFSADTSLTLSAISFTALCYGLANLLLRCHVPFGKIVPFVYALVLPTLGLIPAFDYSGWANGVVSIEAVSLYVHITLLALLARTLLSYSTFTPEEFAQTTARQLGVGLVVVAGILSFILVWTLTHTVATSAVVAVTIALFVYTIAGLLLYVYGKRTNRDMFVRAGYLLLVAVVLRLGLVDVWGMELFWRIITFLGIGALFIIAALLERGSESTRDPEQ